MYVLFLEGNFYLECDILKATHSSNSFLFINKTVLILNENYRLYCIFNDFLVLKLWKVFVITGFCSLYPEDIVGKMTLTNQYIYFVRVRYKQVRYNRVFLATIASDFNFQVDGCFYSYSLPKIPARDEYSWSIKTHSWHGCWL